MIRDRLRLAGLGATLLGCCASTPRAQPDVVPLAVVTGALPSQQQGVKPDATRVSEDAIRRGLKAWGIANIRDWRREGAVFRAVAEWYGELVDLQVDAETGEIRQPERLKGTQIEWMLRRAWGLR